MFSPCNVRSNQSPSRTRFLKYSAAMAAGTIGAPLVHSKSKITLRVLGTHLTLQEPLREKAQQNIVFQPNGSANVLWDASAIQPIKESRIKRWNEISSLTKPGRSTPDAKLCLGDAPYKLLNVQASGVPGAEPSDLISFLPYVHNVGSFAYNSQVIAPGLPYETESWGWLPDPQYKGKVDIVNEPSIGIFDLALAAQARGLVEFNDIGAMSCAEIDTLFDVMISLKMEGHFGGFWNSAPGSLQLMSSGRLVVGSVFSPGISALKGQGIPTIYAAPIEGYRGWHGVMCLSSTTQGRVRIAVWNTVMPNYEYSLQRWYGLLTA